MSKMTIIEGNSNDKDNVRVLMVKGEKGDKGDNGEITYSDVIDNLTSTETQLPLSANQGKQLNEKKINISDIVNNLTSTEVCKPLSANQGKVLKDLFDSNKLSTDIIIDRLVNKKFVLIGDSYTEGYTPDGNVTSWAQLFKTNLNIPSNRIAIYYKGGAGFSRNRANNFYQYITDTILTNDSNVTDVLIVGGYNDNGESANNIKSGVADTITLLKTKYPNAIVHTGIIGYSNNASVNMNMRNVYLNTFRATIENGAKYLANVENILHNPYTMFASDGFHPNQIGQTRLFEYITESLFNGKADIKYDNVTLLNELPYLSSNMSNNIINIRHNNRETLSVSIASLICDGSNQYEIGTITNNYFVGSVFIPVPLILDLTAGSYKMTQGVLRISGNKIYAICFALKDDNSGYYTASNVRNIIIPDFSCAVNSDFI